MLLRKFVSLFVYIFIQVVNTTCEEGSTLAFAIDDTRSMWDDIDQVRKEAKAIMNMVLTTKSTEIRDMVLVTINDPDVILRTKTSSPTTFLNHLDSIRVHNYGNRDCEEMSLTGIEKALQASRQGSYVYVFTDASAKDYYKVDKVKSLCQKKQSQVVFVLTGNCGYPSHKMFTVYYDIARACSGQVFVVHKSQVESVLKAIEMLLRGKNSIFKWINVPKSSTFVPVTFNLDEKAEYALVSTSGHNVHLRVTTTNEFVGPAPDHERIMWNNNGKVIKLINPKPGTYYAWVKGDSTVSVVVYGRTDFTFDYGFSSLEPKKMTDTAKQPIAGIKQHVSINVTDPENSIDIKSIQILDIKNNDAVITELPLKKSEYGVYLTETILSPNFTFKIAVKGEVKKTRESIVRYSRNIDSRIVDLIPKSIPVSVITEGVKIDVNYGSDVSLTCDVSAHPTPSIKWYTSSGILLPSVSSEIDDPKFISYLKLKGVKQSETYVCKAFNKLGTGKEKRIQVNVRPVFTGNENPKAIYDAKFGEDVKIPCKISSYLPISLKWSREGKELRGSNKYSISPDGVELTLKSVDVDMQGAYVCEASLNSDPTVKETLTVEVKIPGLAPPKIQSTTKRNIEVKKGEKIELKCRISQGYPKPHVKWFKKTTGGTQFPVGNTEVLTIDRSSYDHTGQYKCVATNAMGSDAAVFEVTVNSHPKIIVTETKRTFPYDSNVKFNCKVEAYPAPNIVWRDETGSIVPNQKTSQTSEYELINVLDLQNIKKSAAYVCEASNKEGSVTENVNITVLSPFEIQKHIDGSIGIHFGTTNILLCDIKSEKPMNIRWYIQRKDTKSGKRLIIPSDKYTVSEDGTRLTIKSMNIDMTGQYICEASLLSNPSEKVAFSTNVDVVGLLAPEVISSTTVLDEKNLTAICRIKSVPPATMSWEFKQKGSEVFHTIPGSGEELNIPELRLSHTGVYKCVAKNVLGETQRDFNVVVKEKPTITSNDTFYYGLEGDLVMKIPCNVTGFPDPTIIWKKGGKALVTNTKYVVKGNTLYINNPVQSDSEEYTCEANNELGSVTRTFDIEITDNFPDNDKISSETHEIIAEQGKPKIIKCNVVNLEKGSVRWYMDGVLTKQTGNSFAIEKASLSDEGNYTCRINTDEGSNSVTYIVHIGYLPSFDDNSPSPKTIIWQDNDQVLDCAADSQPKAKYEWSHNGKIVATGYNLEQKRITDWGVYKCNVSNTLGSIQKTFKVVTKGCFITKTVSTPNQPLASDQDASTWAVSMSNSDIFLKKNEEIKFSCPSNTKSVNSFKIIPDKKEILAKCITQDMFAVAGNKYRYSDLQCKSKVEPSVQIIAEQCSGSNSKVIRVGFTVNGFLEAYKICYDKNLNVPIYASISSLAPRIGTGADLTQFEWISTPELGNRITGDWKPEGTCKCCYTKGQLVNTNDLPFGPAQAATFTNNLNSVPIWNPSCDGSHRITWQDFNNQIDEISLMYDEWSSWTGASDYDHLDGGLVPRYLWKVMNFNEKSTVMVFVNDKSPMPSDVRCFNPCEPLVDVDRYFYCCSLEEFAEKFKISADTFKSAT